MDCSGCTGFLTNPTANTTIWTNFPCLLCSIFIGAFYRNIICTLMHPDHVPRTGLDTHTTGDAFFFLHLCNTGFIDGNCAEFAYFLTFPTADASIFAGAVSICRTASLTCNESRTIRKLLFYCHRLSLPFIWRSGNWQAKTPVSIQTVICICNRRRCRDGSNFPNANCSAGNVQSWLINHNCLGWQLSSIGYFSLRAYPIDITTPPSICPSQDNGLTALPTSWAATIFSIF